MRSYCILLAAFLVLSLASLRAELPSEEVLLKKGGPEAALMITKARDILSTSQVFATRVVGEPAVATSSCWALTVIVRYDPKAKEFLNGLFDAPTFPEQRLYAIAGLVTLDSAEKKRFASEEISKFATEPVQTQFGNTSTSTDLVTAAYMLIQQGTPYYLFPQLPSLYSTVTVARPAKGKK